MSLRYGNFNVPPREDQDLRPPFYRWPHYLISWNTRPVSQKIWIIILECSLSAHTLWQCKKEPATRTSWLTSCLNWADRIPTFLAMTSYWRPSVPPAALSQPHSFPVFVARLGNTNVLCNECINNQKSYSRLRVTFYWANLDIGISRGLEYVKAVV